MERGYVRSTNRSGLERSKARDSVQHRGRCEAAAAGPADTAALRPCCAHPTREIDVTVNRYQRHAGRNVMDVRMREYRCFAFDLAGVPPGGLPDGAGEPPVLPRGNAYKPQRRRGAYPEGLRLLFVK